jgi:hypothetical protein
MFDQSRKITLLMKTKWLFTTKKINIDKEFVLIEFWYDNDLVNIIYIKIINLLHLK